MLSWLTADKAPLIIALGGVLKILLDYKQSASKTQAVLKDIQSDLNAVKKDTADNKAIAVENRDGTRYTQRFLLQKELTRVIKQNYATVQECEEISALYASYHMLGGNGAIDLLMEKFKKLNVRGE